MEATKEASTRTELDRAFDNLTKAALRVKADRDLLLAAVHEALEFIADQSDVVDGPDGQQCANRAMDLAQGLMGVISRVAA